MEWFLYEKDLRQERFKMSNWKQVDPDKGWPPPQAAPPLGGWESQATPPSFHIPRRTNPALI